MKKLISAFAAVMVITAASGCSDEAELITYCDEKPESKIIPPQIHFHGARA